MHHHNTLALHRLHRPAACSLSLTHCAAVLSCRSVSTILRAMGWYLSPAWAKVSRASCLPCGPERHRALYSGRRYCKDNNSTADSRQQQRRQTQQQRQHQGEMLHANKSLHQCEAQLSMPELTGQYSVNALLKFQWNLAAQSGCCKHTAH